MPAINGRHRQLLRCRVDLNPVNKFRSECGEPGRSIGTRQRRRGCLASWRASYRPATFTHLTDEDLIAYQALFCLRHGDEASAEKLLGEAGETGAHPLTALVKAEFLLKQGQAAAAADLLNWLLAGYPHGLPREPILSGRVMLALALFEQHQVNQKPT
jgi:hypothetical protein